MLAPKYKIFQCPFCDTYNNKKYVTEYTSKYIKCVNPKCHVAYIPRDSKIRHELIKLLSNCDIEEKQLEFMSNKKIIRCNMISCINNDCIRKYNIFCVPHNDKYSICPSCSFKNPHDISNRIYVKRYLRFLINKPEEYECTCGIVTTGLIHKALPFRNDPYDSYITCDECFKKSMDDYMDWRETIHPNDSDSSDDDPFGPSIKKTFNLNDISPRMPDPKEYKIFEISESNIHELSLMYMDKLE